MVLVRRDMVPIRPPACLLLGPLQDHDGLVEFHDVVLHNDSGDRSLPAVGPSLQSHLRSAVSEGDHDIELGGQDRVHISATPHLDAHIVILHLHIRGSRLQTIR